MMLFTKSPRSCLPLRPMARRLKVYPALRPGRLLPGMVTAMWDSFLVIAVVITIYGRFSIQGPRAYA
jgi:hypothetical protein